MVRFVDELVANLRRAGAGGPTTVRGSLDVSTSTATAPDGQLGSGAAGASCAPAGDANTITVLATTSDNTAARTTARAQAAIKHARATRDRPLLRAGSDVR